MSIYDSILPLDKYATSTTNRIFGEEHSVTADAETVFVLERGAFYTKDLALINLTTGVPLVPGTDFNPVHHFTAATNKLGQEVMCAISIINQSIRGIIGVDYRAVGGTYQNLVDPLRAIIESLNEDGRPIEWGQIIGLPDQFVPTEHLHSVYDTFGYEYTVDAQNAIHDAIVNGSQAAVYEVLTQFDNYVTQMETDMDSLSAMLHEHIGATGNVHLLTRTQMSIEKVPNTGWATDQQALTFVQGYFTSPYHVKLIADHRADAYMDDHLAANNPHNITKNTVNLGLVQNYGVATLNDYLTGSNTGYITNILLKQIVDLTVAPLATKAELQSYIDAFNAHINAVNPHGITKALIGLDLVNNYAVANDTQAVAGAAGNLYMTPRGVALAIAALSPVKSFQGRTGAVTLLPSDRSSLGLGFNQSVTFGSVTVGPSTTNSLTMVGNGNNSGFLQNEQGKTTRYIYVPAHQGDDNNSGNVRLLSNQYIKVPYATAERVLLNSGVSNWNTSLFESSFRRVVASGSGILSIGFTLTNGPYAARDSAGTDGDLGYNQWVYSMTMYINPGNRTVTWTGVNWGEAGAPELTPNQDNVIVLTNFLVRHSEDGGHYFGPIFGVFIGGGF